MSNAISGIIDGTQTAEEAFATMFKNIGKAFIDPVRDDRQGVDHEGAGNLVPGGDAGGGRTAIVGQYAIVWPGNQDLPVRFDQPHDGNDLRRMVNMSSPKARSIVGDTALSNGSGAVVRLSLMDNHVGGTGQHGPGCRLSNHQYQGSVEFNDPRVHQR